MTSGAFTVSVAPIPANVDAIWMAPPVVSSRELPPRGADEIITSRCIEGNTANVLGRLVDDHRIDG